MKGRGTLTFVDPLALVGGVGGEPAFLLIGDDLDGEADQPNGVADVIRNSQILLIVTLPVRVDHEDAQGGEGDPSTLDGPDGEEAGGVYFYLVEALVFGVLLYASEEEGAESGACS